MRGGEMQCETVVLMGGGDNMGIWGDIIMRMPEAWEYEHIMVIETDHIFVADLQVCKSSQ
eukprot:1184771-Prorocentrum_minimum.AAC.2